MEVQDDGISKLRFLQEKPKLFGLTGRLLIMYLIQFGAFMVIPYFLLDLGGFYYLTVFIAAIALNIVYKKQMEDLYSRAIYFFSKKRIDV